MTAGVDVLDEGPFFHGTQADLAMGDLLEPGFNSNYGAHPPEVLQHMRDHLAELKRQGIEAINE